MGSQGPGGRQAFTDPETDSRNVDCVRGRWPHEFRNTHIPLKPAADSRVEAVDNTREEAVSVLVRMHFKLFDKCLVERTI